MLRSHIRVASADSQWVVTGMYCSKVPHQRYSLEFIIPNEYNIPHNCWLSTISCEELHLCFLAQAHATSPMRGTHGLLVGLDRASWYRQDGVQDVGHILGLYKTQPSDHVSDTRSSQCEGKYEPFAMRIYEHICRIPKR